MSAPTYLPEAIPTALGWAHPLTGEQLDATSGLADAVDYYKPNARAASFIDPEGETRFLGFSVVTGRKARLVVHSLESISSVEWDFGDGTDPVTGSYAAVHVYPESENDVTYSVTATLSAPEADPEVVEFDVAVAGSAP